MNEPIEVVRAFLDVVRSGADPDRAPSFMAPQVLAHQLQAEDPATVTRTPQQYAEHVHEMRAAYGDFAFAVDELFGQGEKVYARWTQHGHHLGGIDGAAPTGEPVVELASCVYRVVDGLIVEYWIQVDRYGIEAQLRR